MERRLDRLEILKRSAITYYWFFINTGLKYYEVRAYDIAYQYKTLKKLSEDKTESIILDEELVA